MAGNGAGHRLPLTLLPRLMRMDVDLDLTYYTGKAAAYLANAGGRVEDWSNEDLKALLPASIAFLDVVREPHLRFLREHCTGKAEGQIMRAYLTDVERAWGKYHRRHPQWEREVWLRSSFRARERALQELCVRMAQNPTSTVTKELELAERAYHG